MPTAAVIFEVLIVPSSRHMPQSKKRAKKPKARRFLIGEEYEKTATLPFPCRWLNSIRATPLLLAGVYFIAVPR